MTRKGTTPLEPVLEEYSKDKKQSEKSEVEVLVSAVDESMDGDQHSRNIVSNMFQTEVLRETEMRTNRRSPDFSPELKM